jgi:hypothetical protein
MGRVASPQSNVASSSRCKGPRCGKPVAITSSARRRTTERPTRAPAHPIVQQFGAESSERCIEPTDVLGTLKRIIWQRPAPWDDSNVSLDTARTLYVSDTRGLSSNHFCLLPPPTTQGACSSLHIPRKVRLDAAPGPRLAAIVSEWGSRPQRPPEPAHTDLSTPAELAASPQSDVSSRLSSVLHSFRALPVAVPAELHRSWFFGPHAESAKASLGPLRPSCWSHSRGTRRALAGLPTLSSASRRRQPLE